MTREEYSKYLEDKKQEMMKFYPCELSKEQKIDMVSELIFKVKFENDELFLCFELEEYISGGFRKSSQDCLVMLMFNNIHTETDYTNNFLDTITDIYELNIRDKYLDFELDYSICNLEFGIDLQNDFWSWAIISLTLPELFDYMPEVLYSTGGWFRNNSHRLEVLEEILHKLQSI